MGSSYKRLFITVLLIYGWILNISAQQISYELASNESGSSKSYVARDFVSLKPGFTYTSANSDTLDISIDPGLLFIPTENLYKTPNGAIVPEGGIVGAIPGDFSVGNMGNALYTIPIDCPQGNNKLKPNISLIYNSSTKNGILGWGWNLGGISTITRTGSSLY